MVDEIQYMFLKRGYIKVAEEYKDKNNGIFNVGICNIKVHMRKSSEPTDNFL